MIATTRLLLVLACAAAAASCRMTAAGTSKPLERELATGPAQDRPKLVFSLDQGFSNGIVAVADASNPRYVAAIDRIMNTLDAYKTKYDVYALLNPMPGKTDKTHLHYVLNKLKDHGTPFIFDIYSSDTYTIGWRTGSINFAQDLLHGMSMWASDPNDPADPSPFVLDFYVIHFGKLFAGLRIFETGYFSLESRKCRLAGDCSSLGVAPSQLSGDDFFEAPIAKALVAYAAQKGMFVLWSDPIWTRPDLAALPPLVFAPDFLKVFHDSLGAITAAYPGTVYPVYANNDGSYLAHLSDWQSYVQFPGAAGFGLSDQSWGCVGSAFDEMHCPAQNLATWARDAASKGSTVIQFESFWYFFRWPVGTIVDGVDGSGIDWSSAGSATDNARLIAHSLGITLP